MTRVLESSVMSCTLPCSMSDFIDIFSLIYNKRNNTQAVKKMNGLLYKTDYKDNFPLFLNERYIFSCHFVTVSRRITSKAIFKRGDISSCFMFFEKTKENKTKFLTVVLKSDSIVIVNK